MALQNTALGFYFDLPSEQELELSEWTAAIDAMRQLESGAMANPTEQRQVGHYWLRDAAMAPAEYKIEIEQSLVMLEDLAARIQEQSFQTLLMVGIGGSALGPQLLMDALPTGALQRTVYFLDNTDPAGFDRVLSKIDPSKTIVAVISKSGGTKETRNAMLEVEALYDRVGVEFSQHAVAITVAASALDRLAASQGWFGRLPLWNWVGGRTSITGMVGLFPLMFIQRDWRAFLEGAKQMDVWTRPLHSNNPALQLASLWFQEGNGQGDRNMVVLPYKDALGLLGKYLQQLIMESIGKRVDRNGDVVHQGLTVYGNKGSTDQHAFVQQLRDGRHDFFPLLIGVLQDRYTQSPRVLVEDDVGAGEYLLGFLLGTRHALKDAGRTVSTILLDRVDEQTLGALVALFERAVGLYAERININAYDQPGVEAGKRAAAEMLMLREKVLSGADVSDADPFDVWTWQQHQSVNGLS